MPADAEYQCEYFLSSSFGAKSKTISHSFNSTSSSSGQKLTTTTTTTATTNNNNNNKSSQNGDLSTTTAYLETIEFTKYEKNNMEYLKSKYSTLSDNNTMIKKQVSTSGGDSSNNSTATTNNTSSSRLDLNWSRLRRIGIGLLNLGNNCYLNATLQCLAYTPPLSQWLVQRTHSPGCKLKQAKGFCSLCEVERIVYDLFHGHGFAKPNSLCFNIKKISHVFGVGTQEDASEFFTTLLESMAKSIKFGHNNSNNKKTQTVLDEIFSFQFRSRITCGACGRLSDTYENTNTWPIDVKYTQELSKGIAHFLREEVLDGENAYKCDKCGRKVRATKKYSVRTAPNMLVIQLKRFDFSYAGKLSHFVSYPEQLTLKTLLPSNNDVAGHSPAAAAALHALGDSTASNNSDKAALRSVNYKLYGVLVHLGHTSHSGHYYSYVRAPNDVWYKADDQRVSMVQQNEALRQNAYILFYSKVTSDTTTSASTTSSSVSFSPRPLVTVAANGATHFNNKLNVVSSLSPQLSAMLKPNIPQVIRETTTTPVKLSNGTITPSNYLNSLTSPSNSLLLRPDHEKVVFKLKTSVSTTTTMTPANKTVSTEQQQSSNPVTSSSTTTAAVVVSDKEEKKNKKKKLKLSERIKKTKRLIKKQSEEIIGGSGEKSDEERAAKLKTLRKKLKKLKKEKKEKKLAKKNGHDEAKMEEKSEEHVSRKRPLDDDQSPLQNGETRKSKKKRKSGESSTTTSQQVNGLTLLKQYDSSPSPTRSSRSPSLTSLSSMSSANLNNHQLSSSSGSSSPIAKSSTTTTSSPTVNGAVYSYNPRSKVPDVVTTSSSSSPTTTSNNNINSPLMEQMKEKNSLSQLKTWSSDTTSSLKNSNDEYTEYNEDDDYNEDFDRPVVSRGPNHAGMPKFNSHKPDVSGFHLFTHQHHQNGNNNSYNNNYNKKPYYNGNSSNYSNNNNSYQNGGGGGKWNNGQRFNNNYHNGNNNNRFHYYKNGRGGGNGGGGYRGGRGGGGSFNAFHHQR